MKMETVANSNQEMVIGASEIVTNANSNFIEANTHKVSLRHLKDDCTIPVFAKDNETAISHYQFIQKTFESLTNIYPETTLKQPEIRVSHIVKGRIPSAIGKPLKELLDNEKTIYYERCAFVIEIPNRNPIINKNELMLSVGGVRAYNQENLYSKKSLEKFKLFIGYQNRVCTNLCVSTDGFSNEIRVGSVYDLEEKIYELIHGYNAEKHMEEMLGLEKLIITEEQFAHWIGKARMCQHLSKTERIGVFDLKLNDSQVNNVVANYYACNNFKRDSSGNINLWNFYNLMTEANKSSYIDSNLERVVNCYEHVKHLADCIKNGTYSWYLDN